MTKHKLLGLMFGAERALDIYFYYVKEVTLRLLIIVYLHK